MGPLNGMLRRLKKRCGAGVLVDYAALRHWDDRGFADAFWRLVRWDR